jgi:DeoR family transcriptional regulator of aga operon
VRLDIAFIGVNGMDAQAGATTQDEREAAVNRIMAERARRAVVVTDGSKLGVEAFSAVGGVDLFATVITDEGADAAAVEALRAAGYEVLLG